MQFTAVIKWRCSTCLFSGVSWNPFTALRYMCTPNKRHMLICAINSTRVLLQARQWGKEESVQVRSISVFADIHGRRQRFIVIPRKAITFCVDLTWNCLALTAHTIRPPGPKTTPNAISQAGVVFVFKRWDKLQGTIRLSAC